MAETNRKETKKQRHRDIGRKTGMNNTQKQRQTEGEKQETGPQRQKRSESGNSQRRREGDTEASGYRTENIRPGWDVLKDSTAVLLQRSHDPVINPDGFLYKRETFLEYILHQKISGR